VLQVHRFGARTETIWVDVVDPTDDDLRALAEQFHVEERTFEEAHRRSLRPTLAHFETHTYLVVFSGRGAEVDVYLAPGWLVTVRRHDPRGEEWDPSAARERFERRANHHPNVGTLLALMLEDLVDGFFDVADEIEDRLEQVEELIFADEVDVTGSRRTTTVDERDVQQRLFQLRRDLQRIRRVVNPTREVFLAMLRGEVPGLDDAALVVVRDTYDRLLRAVDVIDDLRDLVGNAVDAHLAVISNQTNLVMKRLTAWGSILFVAALIAGIYGMNFRDMPELRWSFGYYGALGLMAGVSVALYLWFRRRRYL
jgi:magnesium transporter